MTTAGTVMVAAGTMVVEVTAVVVVAAVVPVVTGTVVVVIVVAAVAVVAVAVVVVVTVGVAVVAVVVVPLPSTVTCRVPAEGVMTASLSSFIWIPVILSIAVPEATPVTVIVPSSMFVDPACSCLLRSTAVMRYPPLVRYLLFMADAHAGNEASVTLTVDEGYFTVSSYPERPCGASLIRSVTCFVVPGLKVTVAGSNEIVGAAAANPVVHVIRMTSKQMKIIFLRIHTPFYI